MKKLLIFLVFLFLIPYIGNAAISADSTGSTSNGSATTISYSQTISASATLEVVEVLSGGTLVGATVGGVSYTGSITNTSHGGYPYYVLWWLNPPTGSQSVSATITVATGVFVVRSASYIGVGNIAPQTQLTPQSPSETSFTTTAITPTYANSWLIGVMENSAAPITAGTGTFFRAGSGNGDGIFDSNGTVSGASSLNGTSGAHIWTAAICAFAPTGATHQNSINGISKITGVSLIN